MVQFLSKSLLLLCMAHQATAWTIPTALSRRPSSPLAAAAAEDDAEDATLASVYSSSSEPYAYFQMQAIPTATWDADVPTMAGSASRLDHVVDCAENGECDVEEMTAMIDELERLNAECSSETSMSRECHLDAVAARNVLKVALASKVMVEDAMRTDEQQEIEEDPYASMMELDDEYHGTMQGIPTAAMEESDLDRIVQCAENGECPVGEMTDMIDELERLNMECEGTISRECSLDAYAARNILKVALASQAAMARSMMEQPRTRGRGAEP